jgi:hypothetical protein
MKQQFLVYFMSEVLTRSKKFYSKMEKICYAVIMSSQKLRHYFEAHTIKVLTNQPMNDIFGNRDSSKRISKWAMELSEYIVDFKKRSTIVTSFSWFCGRMDGASLRDRGWGGKKHRGWSTMMELGGNKGQSSSRTPLTFGN